MSKYFYEFYAFFIHLYVTGNVENLGNDDNAKEIISIPKSQKRRKLYHNNWVGNKLIAVYKIQQITITILRGCQQPSYYQIKNV